MSHFELGTAIKRAGGALLCLLCSVCRDRLSTPDKSNLYQEYTELILVHGCTVSTTTKHTNDMLIYADWN